MSTALANKDNTALALPEQELMLVLKNSLYPGAQDESIKLVLGYCKASGLDPMHKPVHIVPMYDSKIGGYRDTIMPGIGLYRTQAARSGEYAGVSDAEYGPDVTENLSGVQITYPAWCRVTVRRLLKTGQIAEFTATERWKENYAVKGGKEKSIAPNSMWSKRPYAQIAKCAEAQALRKAFPEFGAQPTSDEMEGKEIEINPIQQSQLPTTKAEPVEVIEGVVVDQEDYPDEGFAKNKSKWCDVLLSGRKTIADIENSISTKGFKLSSKQKAEMESWLVDAGLLS